MLLLLLLPFFLFITETSSPLKSQIIVPIAGGGDTQPLCVMHPQLCLFCPLSTNNLIGSATGSPTKTLFKKEKQLIQLKVKK